MSHESILILIILAVGGLVALNALSYLSKKWQVIPEIIWIILFGAGYGALAHFSDWALPTLKITPDLILSFFVPLLIFASAQNICLFHFRKILIPASIAGTLGILISMMIIGGTLHYGFAIPFLPALLFGVIISATDPLAVGALLRGNTQISESQKLLIEGESILNDGFVVTMAGLFTLILFGNEKFTLIGASESLLLHVIGAILIGIIFGRGARWLLCRWEEEYFTLTTNMTLAIAFGAYAFSEFFGFSGILAVLAGALSYGFMSDKKSHNNHTQAHLWEYFEYLANSALFFLLGASLFSQPDFDQGSFLLAVTIVLLLFFSRFMALLIVYPIMRLDGKALTKKTFWLLNFSGARGAVSIALILLLPETFEYKSLFLSLAFVMIFTSLLIYPLVLKQILKPSR